MAHPRLPKAHQAAPTQPARSVPSTITGTPDDDNLIQASEVWSDYGVTGQGMTVAVIDTGVNYNHEALGGGFGPGHKVIAGEDFADGTADPLATDSQHGTAVAGLIASSDPNHPGVAPGADIAALRVFGNSQTGDYTNVADALQWVIDNHDQYNITVVNLSLTDGNNYTQNVFAQDGGVGQQITTLIGELDSLNIPVVAASGNSNNGPQGMGFPAIVPETISVTASDAQDHIVSNAQRLDFSTGGISATDLAAPGIGLIAPTDGTDGFASADGTSFAAPLVSGAVVLLQQIYESRFHQLPTVEQIDSWLTQGADLATDPATGFSIPRLDVARAAALIPGPVTVAAQSLAGPARSIHSPTVPTPSSKATGNRSALKVAASPQKTARKATVPPHKPIVPAAPARKDPAFVPNGRAR
jgi:type VI secretion system secreted protein VgrG